MEQQDARGFAMIAFADGYPGYGEGYICYYTYFLDVVILITRKMIIGRPQYNRGKEDFFSLPTSSVIYYI